MNVWESKNEYCHVLAFLIKHSFTETKKKNANSSNKIIMYKILLLLKFGKRRISQ